MSTVVKDIYDATWGRIFACGYDFFLLQSERHGLNEIRANLLKDAYGSTVEIGAGSGLNIPHYPPTVTALDITDPNPHMLGQLRRKAAQLPIETRVAEAAGESLPFPDSCFDTAVMTMVLCTAPSPQTVLGEIARVLKPTGQLLFFEHVRSEDPTLAAWQDRLATPWRFFGHGCNPNRDTLTTVEQSLFTVEEIHTDRASWVPPIVQPLIVGRATVQK